MLAWVLGLASIFIKAVVSSAGSALGQRLVAPALSKYEAVGASHLLSAGGPKNQPDQVQAQRILVQGLQQDAAYREQVHAAVVAAVPQADAHIEAAKLVFERTPTLAQAVTNGSVNLFDDSWLKHSERDLFGFSDPELDYLYGPSSAFGDWSSYCPIGRERLTFLTGVTYRDGNGKEAHPWTFHDYMDEQAQMVRKSSVVATCEHGHQWPVFAN